MMKTFETIARGLATLAVLVLFAARSDASSSSYLSLGDSLAYGPGSSQDNGTGGTSSGFVSQYASSLAAANGGVAPSVINLALPGEALATYGSTDSNYTANTNYIVQGTSNGQPQASQQDMFYHYVMTAASSGSPVTNVTISLGMQDMMNVINAQGFTSLSSSQQNSAIQAGLSTVSSQYATLLSEIRGLLPNAKIDIIGAYNPYNATPNSPLAGAAQQAITGLNTVLQSVAGANNATYVNTYSAFLGNEGTFTNILNNGSINPTPAGYSAIANLLSPTVAPEPSSIALALAGVVGLAGHAWRRRRAA